MKTIEEIAKTAAEWWADKVCCPRFDNGDQSRTGGLGMMLALMSTEQIPATNKQLFLEKLSEKIVSRFERSRYDLILDVDYHPDMILSEVAKMADISTNNFPWKTTMWVSEHHIAVRYGYSAPIKYLFFDAEYCEKRIKSQKESVIYYQNEDNLRFYNDPDQRAQRMKEDQECATKELEFWEGELNRLLTSI